MQRVVADLLAKFQGYEVSLSPEDKPEENDVVRLLRPLPERNLRAGSTGTVVVDYTAKVASPPSCADRTAD